MTASSSEPAAIDWIECEVLRHHGKGVELPSAADSNNSLCEFLRDGRALCLLASALADDVNNANKNDQEFALPKKIEKSMHQLSTFHGLERIHYFIRWCRAAAKLEEHLVFTSVQLLDETNADAVLATVDALRTRFRPSFVSTIKPAPVAPSPEDEEEEDNNATENDTETSSVTSSRSSTAPASSSSLANKLNAFLTKVPPAPPTIAPTVERQTSLSNSSINSRDSRVASVTSSERADDDDQTSESSSESRNRSSSNSRLSASPRVSKLKLPGAFASLATVTIPPPPVEEEEPPVVEEEPVAVTEEVNSSTPNRDAVDDFDERIKVVSKLEIPMVFGRQRSASSVDESSSVKSEGGESAKALPRSVSKLKIPKAFAGGAGDEAPPPPVEEEPAAPVVEEPISNSPKSKLAAFAKTLAPTPPPAEPVPAEETKPKRKSNGKLKIPAAFGKAVGDTPAAKAAIAKKKPVTKLSAFLSTVENNVPPPIEAKPEKRFAFPIPGTEEAKKPVKKPEPAKPAVTKAAAKSVKLMAFMTKVVAAPPTMAPRIERDVPDHPHEDETEKKIEEEPSVETAIVEEEKTTQPLSARGSALAAFMKKVVVAPPAPAPRVERDEPSEPVKEKAEEIVTQEPAAATLTVELVEEESSVDPSPKANRLLAFLAKNESPKAPLSEADEEENADDDTAQEEEEEAATAHVPTEENVEEEAPVSAVVEDDDDDDFARPVVNADPDHDVIVEVSGELTHEAILRRRLSLSSPRAKPKTIAARKLFPDDEEEEEDASVRKSTEAGQTKLQLQAENESLKQKLVSVEAVVTSQASSIETLQAELKALREQLETQTQQLTAVQQTLADQQIVVTQAKESEEAARYAARQAFTARDEAEEARRKLQEKLDELTRAA